MTLGAGMNWPVNRVSSPHSCFRHDISSPITLRSISYYVTLQYRPRTLPTPTDQQSKSKKYNMYPCTILLNRWGHDRKQKLHLGTSILKRWLPKYRIRNAPQHNPFNKERHNA